MDENKDLKTPENLTETEKPAEDTQEITQPEAEEAQTAVEAEAADAVADSEQDGENNAPTEQDGETAALTEQDGETAADEAEAVQPVSKKKPILQTTIIISIVIVAIAVLTTLAVRLFFNNDITGTWHLVRQVQVMDDAATSDEAVKTLDVDYYFDFKNDGSVSSTIGTVSSTGTYSTSKDENGNSVVSINNYDVLTQYFLEGDYTVELSGNVFTGKKMTFTSVSSPELSYEFESSSYKAPKIEREEEFTLNDDLVGKWSYSTGEFNLVYQFNKDGTAKYIEQAMSINPYTYSYVNIDISMSGIYTVNDGSVTISYYLLEQSNKDITFRLDGDTLYINDYPFTKDGAATVDQAQTAAAQ